MEEDWADAYWVLYDCLWASESAITQRIVDLHRNSSFLYRNSSIVDRDETFQQLNQARTSLIISIFHKIPGPMTPAPSLLESLAVTLLDWDADLDNFLSRQDSLIVSLVSPRVQKFANTVS